MYFDSWARGEVGGRLGADPVIDPEKSLGRISIGVNDYYLPKGSKDWKSSVSWIDVTFWGKQAEKLKKLKKGDLVVVTFQLKTSVSEKRKFLNLHATGFMKLNPKHGSTTREEDPEPPTAENIPEDFPDAADPF